MTRRPATLLRHASWQLSASQRRNLSTSVQSPPAELDGGVKAAASTATDDGLESRTTPAKAWKPRRVLPLSPLMDPEFHAARARHSQPKSKPTSERTPLQRQLEKNPYGRTSMVHKALMWIALALASPVRQCSTTLARLPSSFLQDFMPISHPKTGEPWLMPSSLTKRYYISVDERKKVKSDVPSRSPRVGPKGYALARRDLIESYSAAGHHFIKPQQLIGHRGLMWPKFQELDINWRPDMADMVMNLMRDRLLEALTYLGSPDRIYVFPCPEGYEQAKNITGSGAILWFGALDASEAVSTTSRHATAETSAVAEADLHQAVGNSAGEMSAVETPPSGPPSFATVDLESRKKIPVYNMQRLLGGERIRKLRGAHPAKFNVEHVVVTQKPMTAHFLLRLWQIEGFACDFGVAPLTAAQIAKKMAYKPKRKRAKADTDVVDESPWEHSEDGYKDILDAAVGGSTGLNSQSGEPSKRKSAPP